MRSSCVALGSPTLFWPRFPLVNWGFLPPHRVVPGPCPEPPVPGSLTPPSCAPRVTDTGPGEPAAGQIMAATASAFLGANPNLGRVKLAHHCLGPRNRIQLPSPQLQTQSHRDGAP